jgi:hypothetical protein
VQKVGASFVVKKLSDYMMSPSRETEEQVDARPAEQTAPDLDGQVITDENGERLGVARRLAAVNVYLIADTRAGLDGALVSTIDDPDHRVFFHRDEGGRLTGLIFVPDPSSRPAPVVASRSDDI